MKKPKTTYEGTVLNREEAVTVLKELLDCTGLDGHPLELTPPNTATSGGYQIIIGKPLNQETKNHITDIVIKHQLAYQTGSMWKTRRSTNTEPDTLIIYKPRQPHQ